MELEDKIHNLILSRDEKGLSLLYDNYSAALYGTAYRILNDHPSSEEVLQNSFLKVWKNIDKYDNSKSTLFTWMNRIVKNTAIDTYRLVSFQNNKKSKSIETVVYSIKAVNVNHSNNIDTTRMIEGMEEKYAVVLDYLYLRGFSQADLSEELGIPLGTVKSRVKKALDILRKRYKGESASFISIIIKMIFAISGY